MTDDEIREIAEKLFSGTFYEIEQALRTVRDQTWNEAIEVIAKEIITTPMLEAESFLEARARIRSRVYSLKKEPEKGRKG